MHEPKSYTAYYKPVPLNFWFYFWLVLLILMLLGVTYNLIRLIWPSSFGSSWENWFTSTVHGFIFYSAAERMYKQYKNSRVNNCFIKVDSEGISWRLPKVNYDVKESEMIVWGDVKKIVIDEKKITVKYMSTYFSDNIPFDTITEENRALLIEALNDQIQHRSIPYENQIAA